MLSCCQFEEFIKGHKLNQHFQVNLKISEFLGIKEEFLLALPVPTELALYQSWRGAMTSLVIALGCR